MQTEKTLSPQDSLRLITETIQKTREDFGDMSFDFLLWGWLISAAGVGEFLLGQYTELPMYLPWMIFPIIGGIISFLHHRKEDRKSGTETHLSFFLGKLWMVLGFAIFTVIFVSIHQHVLPATYTALLAGVGTLVTGLTLRFRPLQIGGIVFFVAAFVCAFTPDIYKALVHSGAIVLGYLVPGYLLRAKNAH